LYAGENALKCKYLSYYSSELDLKFPQGKIPEAGGLEIETPAYDMLGPFVSCPYTAF